MRVTGHRCESSLRSYSYDNSDEQKRQISDTLMKPTISAFNTMPPDNDIIDNIDNDSTSASTVTTQSHSEEPQAQPDENVKNQAEKSATNNGASAQVLRQVFYNYNCVINIKQ